MDKKEKLLIEIVCIIVLSNFLCMFCFLFLNLAFQGNMEELASILSLVISFVIMPFYVLKKQHNIKISEIGIAKIGITDSIFLISAVILNNPVPVSLLSGDRKPQIRFLGNHHSGSGNLYHKSFRM